MPVVPNMTYSVKLNNTLISVQGETAVGGETVTITSGSHNMKVSYQPPFNKITGTFKSTNTSLQRFEIRVTPIDSDYDVTLGTRVFYTTGSLAANTDYNFEFTINSTNFPTNGTTYRVGLYARAATDSAWNVSYLLLDVNSYTVKPTDYDTVDIISDKNPI